MKIRKTVSIQPGNGRDHILYDLDKIGEYDEARIREDMGDDSGCSPPG